MPLGRPWSVQSTSTTPGTAMETFGGVLLAVTQGTLEATAEPYLELREQEYSVSWQHIAGNLTMGDRATLDLVTEDGRHRLSYGLVFGASEFQLTAEYVTFDAEGNGTTTMIGEVPYPGNDPIAELVIRHQNQATKFLVGSGGAPTQKFSTELAPLDWIGYMRPILQIRSTLANTYVARTFNGAVPPIGEACPASAIGETFEPDLSSEWQRVSRQCDFAIDAGGDLRMTFSDADVDHECVLHTSTLYDLRGHQIEVELAEVIPATATAMRVELEVETRTSRARLRLDIDAQALRAIIDTATGEASVGDAPIELGQLGTRSVWRVSATTDDSLIFEVGDGARFEPLGATQVGAVGALDQVRLRLITTGAGIGMGARARFSEIRSQ